MRELVVWEPTPEFELSAIRGEQMMSRVACGLLSFSVAFWSFGCDDGDPSPGELGELDWTNELAAEEGAGSDVVVAVQALSDDGEPLADVSITFGVARGGGSLSAAEAVTDAEGRAETTWTLGIAPVLNRIEAVSGEASISLETTAVVTDPWACESFGTAEAFLSGESNEGTSEDLVFDSQDQLLLGVGEGLLLVDQEGEPSWMSLSGDELVGALGMSLDSDGNVWIADGGGPALRRVSPAGVVTTPLAGDAGLVMPNDVVAGPDGAIYLTDTCSGLVSRFDPASGAVVDTLEFDLATQGGPNGVAFDANGVLYLTTENAVTFCDIDGDPDARVGGLYRVPVADDGFGELEALFPEVAQFGDGLAFDAEGNLYAIFDRLEGVDFESMILVLPAGGDELLPFVSALDRVLANVIFGRGEYGESTLYVALLAIPPFLRLRGVERLELGIPGL